MNFEERPEVQAAYQSQFEPDHIQRLEDEFNAHIELLVDYGVYSEAEGEEYIKAYHEALRGSYGAE